MEKKTLDIAQIKEIIPHRYPFHRLTKIIEIELEPVTRAVAIKT